MRIAAVWFVVLVGCGGPTPTCKDALAHAKLGLDAAVAVCEQNHWSADVRRCLATAPNQREVKKCLEPVELDLAAIYRAQSDELARAAADAQRAQVEAAAKAKAELDALVTKSNELAAQTEAAVSAIASATSDAERKTAQATLARLQHETADLRTKLDAARAGSGSP